VGSMRPLALLLLLVLASPARSQDVTIPLLEGVMAPQVPTNNLLTAAKVEFGKKLYVDPRLSKDRRR